MNSYEQFIELQQNFKTHLNQDKKYQPILKKLVVLLREVKPKTTEIFTNLKQIEKDYAKALLDIMNKEQVFFENVERSAAIAIKKHKKWTESTQKQKNQHATILQNELRLKLEAIDDDIEKAKIDYKTELVKLENIYKRELSAITKHLQALKKSHDEQNVIVASEKSEALLILKQSYDQHMASLDQQIKSLETTFEQDKDDLKHAHDEKITHSDENYLNIKNDYSQLSIHLNQKINDIKKVYQKDLSQLKHHVERDNKPLNLAIDTLKNDYKEAISTAIDQHQVKLSLLNSQFDQQKESYEHKKARIITDINQAITLLNSKLSAFRESTQKDKLNTSRTMRSEIKLMEDVREQDAHNRKLTRSLSVFDNELNRQIIRTQKDIDDKHAQMQKKLYEHDQNHLREISQWRLSKQIFSYEHKQELAKLELNYTYNLNDIELQLKRLSDVYNYDKEKRLLNHNRSLLPLEFQLTIASLVQERELNLLSNDTHQYHDEYQYLVRLKTIEQAFNKTLLDYDQKIIKAQFQSDEAVLLTMSQVELQKEKLKHESGQLEQHIRKDIQDSILNKNKEALNQQLKLNERHLTLNKYKLEAETKTKIANLNHDATVLYHRQSSHVENLKLKTLHQKSIRRTKNLKKIQKLELIKKQKELECLVSHNLFITRHYGSYVQLIEALYLLPAHPELFKQFLAEFYPLNDVYHELMTTMLNHFKALDLGYYQNKLEDYASYKSQLKFDHHINTLNYQSERIEKIKDELFKEVKQIGSQILTLQTQIDKENQVSKSLHNQLKNPEIGLAKKHEIMHHLKDQDKMISKLSNQRDLLDKKITRLHKKMVPQDEQINKIENKKSQLAQKLSTEKNVHQKMFKYALEQNEKHYDALRHRINQFKGHTKTFIAKLSEEVYVTDQLLSQYKQTYLKHLTQLSGHIVMHYHNLLNQSFKTYQKQHHQQSLIAQRFKKSLKNVLKSQIQTHGHQNHIQLRKNTMHQTHIARNLADLSHNIHKEVKNYKASYQLRLNEYVLKIRMSEKNLESETSRFVQEMKSLNDNQVDVAKTYQADHQNTLSLLGKQLDREKAHHLQEQQNLTKSYDEYVQSTQTKNKALITKYEVNHQKQLDLLKNRKLHYTDKLKKEASSIDKKMTILQKHKQNLTRKRRLELTNMQQHLIEFKAHQKRDQHADLRKDLSTLKKSYRFKLRALKLHP